MTENMYLHKMALLGVYLLWEIIWKNMNKSLCQTLNNKCNRQNILFFIIYLIYGL